MRCANPSIIAVFPTPGSPIKTGLFFVRLESTCTVRLISSSRPMTGSSLPSRAMAVKSCAYLFSASNWSSELALSAVRPLRRELTASFNWRSVTPASSRYPATSLFLASTMACKIRSIVTNLSPDFSAKFKALSMIFARSLERRSCPAPGPSTAGNLEIARSILRRSAVLSALELLSSFVVRPSSSSSMTFSRCSGSRD